MNNFSSSPKNSDEQKTYTPREERKKNMNYCIKLKHWLEKVLMNLFL